MSEAILAGSQAIQESPPLSWEKLVSISTFTVNSYGNGNISLSTLDINYTNYCLFQARMILTSRLNGIRFQTSPIYVYLLGAKYARASNSSSATNYIEPGEVFGSVCTISIIEPSGSTSVAIPISADGRYTITPIDYGQTNYELSRVSLCSFGYSENPTGKCTVELYGLKCAFSK